jgi:hypothetical protein
MDSNLKQILNQIDNFLTTADRYQAQDLWSILTALRGPDSDNDQIKYETTAVIRALAFPEAAKTTGQREDSVYQATLGYMVNTKVTNQDTWLAVSKLKPGHFRDHIKFALRILTK